MEMSMEGWFSELEMDDYLIDEFPAQYSSGFDGELVQIMTLPEDNIQLQSPSSCLTSALKCNSSTSNTSTTAEAATTVTSTCGGSSIRTHRNSSAERPAKRLKADDAPPNTGITTKQQQQQINSSNSSESKEKTLEVEMEAKDDDGVVVTKEDSNGEEGKSSKSGKNRSNSMNTTRTPLELKYRVMAERARREKLSQSFIALSAMLPGLKKIDKASILGDGIKYLGQLKENIKSLEEKINKKSELESVAAVKKSQLCVDDDTSSSKDSLPEIEVRISEKFVLIRIHCQKQKGFVVKLLSEIEKLHLTITNTNFLPFGQCYMDITVVAQMEAEFSCTVMEIVRKLRSALSKFT